MILGGLIQGINVENGAFAGGSFDWATPFALLCGLGVVAGYALLGATWLVMKTDGAVAERARAQAQAAAARRAGFMAVVSLWTPLAFERIAERWFSRAEHSFLCGRCRSSPPSPRSLAGAGSSADAKCRRSSLRSRCFCSAISAS